MRRKVVVCTGLAILLCVNGAWADWSQGFQENGVGPYDLVGVHMTSAGDFFVALPNPIQSGFNVGGWTTAYENANRTLGSATGPATSDMTWSINFAGLQSNAFAFDFFAYNGTTLAESAHADWNGGAWTITGPATQNLTRGQLLAPVPVPAAVLIGLLGLGTAGLKLRKHV